MWASNGRPSRVLLELLLRHLFQDTPAPAGQIKDSMSGAKMERHLLPSLCLGASPWMGCAAAPPLALHEWGPLSARTSLVAAFLLP